MHIVPGPCSLSPASSASAGASIAYKGLADRRNRRIISTYPLAVSLLYLSPYGEQRSCAFAGSFVRNLDSIFDGKERDQVGYGVDLWVEG